MGPALLTVLVAWGVVTTLLVIGVVYRSALSTHEERQIFLGAGETDIAREQQELGAKLNRLGRSINILMALSGILIVIAAVVWIWEGLRTL
jgi:hypothetical protein